MAEQRGQLTAALLQIEATQTELVRRARDEVVELAIQIARHIVGRDVAREDHDLSPVIDDALSRLGDALSIVVRVGARHHAVVAERYGHGRVRVVLDHALRDGDVVLDSDCGSVDARLESRCDAVTSAIRRSTGLP